MSLLQKNSDVAVGAAGSLILLLGTRFRWDLGCSGGHQELGQGHQHCQLQFETPRGFSQLQPGLAKTGLEGLFKSRVWSPSWIQSLSYEVISIQCLWTSPGLLCHCRNKVLWHCSLLYPPSELQGSKYRSPQAIREELLVLKGWPGRKPSFQMSYQVRWCLASARVIDRGLHVHRYIILTPGDIRDLLH